MLAGLDQIFTEVSRRRRSGEIEVLSMGDLAARVIGNDVPSSPTRASS